MYDGSPRRTRSASCTIRSGQQAHSRQASNATPLIELLYDNFTPRQAAEYVGLSTSLLAKLRMSENRSRGPAFVKIGKAVIYRRADLDAWLASHVVEAA